MRVLIVSPHMDDETIGAGGTILKYVNEGAEVFWLNITNTKEEYGYPHEIVAKREKQRLAVAEKLGVVEAIDLKLEPAHLDQYRDSEVISKIGEIVSNIKPEVIITTYSGDIHSDHYKVFSWVKAFSKSFRNPYLKKFMMMEVVSETDFALSNQTFSPNYFVDISDYLKSKLEIVQIYEQELKAHPFPRSLENITALATNRGAVAGVKYAEAFMLLRAIEK